VYSKGEGDISILWRFDPIPSHDLPLWGFAITQFGQTALCRTPPDEWSARRRSLYLTKHNTHKTDIHASGRIRSHDPNKLAAAKPRLRLRGHWNRRRKDISRQNTGLQAYNAMLEL